MEQYFSPLFGKVMVFSLVTAIGVVLVSLLLTLNTFHTLL